MATQPPAGATGKQLHGVFKALLNGRHTRGPGGVLYVKGDACAYRFPTEFPDANFATSLQSIVDDDAGHHMYVVEERDAQLHLLAYPHAHIVAEVAQSIASTTSEECQPQKGPQEHDDDDVVEKKNP